MSGRVPKPAACIFALWTPLAYAAVHEVTNLPPWQYGAEYRIAAAPMQAGSGQVPYGLSDPLVALTQPALLSDLPGSWSTAIAGSGLRGHPTFSVATAWTGDPASVNRFGFAVGTTGVSLQKSEDVSAATGVPPRADYAIVAGSYQRGVVSVGTALRLSPRGFAVARDIWSDAPDSDGRSLDAGLAVHKWHVLAAISYESLGDARLPGVVRLGYCLFFDRPGRRFPIDRFSGYMSRPTHSTSQGSQGWGFARRGSWLIPDGEWTAGMGFGSNQGFELSAGLSATFGQFKSSVAWTSSKDYYAGSRRHAVHLGLTLNPPTHALTSAPN